MAHLKYSHRLLNYYFIKGNDGISMCGVIQTKKCALCMTAKHREVRKEGKMLFKKINSNNNIISVLTNGVPA